MKTPLPNLAGGVFRFSKPPDICLRWLLKNGAHKFTYSFKKPSQDPGLWAADAVVWAYAKGGAWRDEVRDRVEHVVAP